MTTGESTTALTGRAVRWTGPDLGGPRPGEVGTVGPLVDVDPRGRHYYATSWPGGVELDLDLTGATPAVVHLVDDHAIEGQADAEGAGFVSAGRVVRYAPYRPRAWWDPRGWVRR
jgi:hypothetical protein